MNVAAETQRGKSGTDGSENWSKGRESERERTELFPVRWKVSGSKPTRYSHGTDGRLEGLQRMGFS